MPDETKTPGLPEGLRVVRFGTPLDGEFELAIKVIGTVETPYIYKNRPGQRQPGTIVTPVEGYEMVEDPRTKTWVPQKIKAPEACAEESHAVKLGDVLTFAFEFQGQPAGTRFTAMLPEDPADLRGAQLVHIT
jgi:hypothetical protein